MKSSLGVLVNTGLALTVGVLGTLLYMEKRKKPAAHTVTPETIPSPMPIQNVPEPILAPTAITPTVPALPDPKNDLPKQIVLTVNVPEGVEGTPDVSVFYPGWVPEQPSSEELQEELERRAPHVEPPSKKDENRLMNDPLMAEELIVRTLDYIDDSTLDMYSSSTSDALPQIVFRRAEEVGAAVDDLREFLRKNEIYARPRRNRP